jgi:flagellar hook-associated protein 3 FlgL
MRVTFGSSMVPELADLQQSASELAKYQEQVSSGKRVSLPSDDPSAMADSIRQNADLSSIDELTLTADSANSRLTVTDSVLTDLVNQLTSAQSVVASALGTTQTASQRDALAQQLAGVRDAIFSDMDTTFSGSYLFSGGLGQTAPYTKNPDGSVSTYQGDTKPMSVNVGQNEAVPISFDGSAMMQGSDSQDLFAAFQQLITAVQTGDQAGMTAGQTALTNAFNRVTGTQSTVGANLDAISNQEARLSTMQLADQSQLSTDVDANMAESISAMQQANTAYQAALGAIGTSSKLSLLDYLT